MDGAFRPNQKVFVIIALTMMALFLPLLGVAWLAKDYFASRAKPVGQQQVEAPGIRETIERSASEIMPEQPIAAERPVLTAPSAEGLGTAAKSVGATLVELEPGRRFLVSGPPGTYVALGRAIGVSPTYAEAPSGDELFEVIIAP